MSTPSNALATAADAPNRLALAETRAGVGFVHLTTLVEARTFAMVICNSGMAPPNYTGPDKVNDAIVAMQWGAEIGLSPLQALQSIAVINNRPGLWGDGFRAMIVSAPDLEDIIEEEGGDGLDAWATCEIKRRGRRPVKRRFTMRMAERAKLLGKNGTPWQTYPERMLTWKALSWAGRDCYADRLRGMDVANVLSDIPPTTIEAYAEPVELQLENRAQQAIENRRQAAEAATTSTPATEDQAPPADPPPPTTAPPAPEEPPTQTERGQCITSTSYSPATAKRQACYFIDTDKSGSYLTSSEQLYNEASSCIDTGVAFSIVWRPVRLASKALGRAMVQLTPED